MNKKKVHSAKYHNRHNSTSCIVPLDHNLIILEPSKQEQQETDVENCKPAKKIEEISSRTSSGNFSYFSYISALLTFLPIFRLREAAGSLIDM